MGREDGGQAGMNDRHSGRVVGEGLYIDDNARICEYTLLALFGQGVLQRHVYLGSRVVTSIDWR